jgi:hypothetical protein
VLKHKAFVVFDRKSILLFRVGHVLFEFKFKLINKYFSLFLILLQVIWLLISLFDDSLQEVLRLELDYWLDAIEGFRYLGGRVIRTEGDQVAVGHSVRKQVEVRALYKVTDVHNGPEVQVRVKLEYFVH